MTEPGSVKWRTWLGSRHKWIRVFVAVTVLVVLAGVIGAYKTRHVIYRQVLLAHIAYSIPDQSTDGDLAIALLDATLESAPGRPKGVVDDNAAGRWSVAPLSCHCEGGRKVAGHGCPKRHLQSDR